MNENLLKGLIFLAGCAAGGVVGYLIAKKKIGDEAAIDMAETREYYKKKEKELEAKHEAEMKYHTSKVVRFNEPAEVDGNEYFEDSLKTEHPEDEEEELKEQLSKAAMMEDTGESEESRVFTDSIYLISNEQFENDELGQNYETVWLFAEDRVLVTKDYERELGPMHVYTPINSDVIGSKIIDSVCSGKLTIERDEDGDRVFWVRNESNNTDYEVYVVHDSYYHPEDDE